MREANGIQQEKNVVLLDLRKTLVTDGLVDYSDPENPKPLSSREILKLQRYGIDPYENQYFDIYRPAEDIIVGGEEAVKLLSDLRAEGNVSIFVITGDGVRHKKNTLEMLREKGITVDDVITFNDLANEFNIPASPIDFNNNYCRRVIMDLKPKTDGYNNLSREEQQMYILMKEAKHFAELYKEIITSSEGLTEEDIIQAMRDLQVTDEHGKPSLFEYGCKRAGVVPGSKNALLLDDGIATKDKDANNKTYLDRIMDKNFFKGQCIAVDDQNPETLIKPLEGFLNEIRDRKLITSEKLEECISKIRERLGAITEGCDENLRVIIITSLNGIRVRKNTVRYNLEIVVDILKNGIKSEDKVISKVCKDILQKFFEVDDKNIKNINYDAIVKLWSEKAFDVESLEESKILNKNFIEYIVLYEKESFHSSKNENLEKSEIKIENVPLGHEKLTECVSEIIREFEEIENVNENERGLIVAGLKDFIQHKRNNIKEVADILVNGCNFQDKKISEVCESLLQTFFHVGPDTVNYIDYDQIAKEWSEKIFALENSEKSGIKNENVSLGSSRNNFSNENNAIILRTINACIDKIIAILEEIDNDRYMEFKKSNIDSLRDIKKKNNSLEKIKSVASNLLTWAIVNNAAQEGKSETLDACYRALLRKFFDAIPEREAELDVGKIDIRTVNVWEITQLKDINVKQFVEEEKINSKENCLVM